MVGRAFGIRPRSEADVLFAGPVAGTLVTSAARAAGEHSSIEAPDFVAGPAAVFVQHCELQGLPCRVDVSTPQPALSLYL